MLRVCTAQRSPQALASLLPMVGMGAVMSAPVASMTQTQTRTYARRKRKDILANGDLDEVVSKILEDHGSESLRKYGEVTGKLMPPEEVISTGSLGLDVALGVGGLPRGRIVEIYGPEACGKTTLALHVIAEAQKAGGKCTFIDAEHALDAHYASAIGVNMEDLYLCQPDCGEQALDITEALVMSNVMDVIVIDSVAALVPRAELEGDMGDHHIGRQARLMSQALRKLTGGLAKSNTLLIFINQIRMKVGVIFGSPETTSGGVGLKFYCSARLEIRRKGFVKEGTDITGTACRVKVTKNKVAPPYREAEFDIEFGKGISRLGELVDLAVECDIFQKRGAWYACDGHNIAQGRERAKGYLAENPDFAAWCERLVRDSVIYGKDISAEIEAGYTSASSVSGDGGSGVGESGSGSQSDESGELSEEVAKA